MAQHDYDIANQTYPNTRADINSALAAARTLNSGATEPSSTTAYMLWADTTSGLLKQRNAADSAWVTIGTMAATNWGLMSLSGGTLTGALLASTGLVSAPGIAFAGDPNTGFYWVSADILACATGGVEAWRVNASQQTLFPNGSASVPPVSFASDSSSGLARLGANSFSGIASGAETWRTNTNGLCVGATDVINVGSGSTDGATLAKTGYVSVSCNGQPAALWRRRSSDGQIQTFNRDTTTVGSISVTATATTYATSSDARIKKDIEPLGGTGAVIDALRPSTWGWRYVPDAPRGIGFIAQELHAVAPQAVTPGDGDPAKRPGDPGFEQWGVDMAKLVPYLVAEVQDLRRRLAALEGAA